MSPESRAEYYRERRKKFRQLVFMIDPEKADQLDEKLRQRGETRIQWFRRIVDREISE
ncbi:MAG: hypothetical protein IKR07_03535 [Oscillospiraceae bacterium]|nr:hypothetical protein [Oscillospiraceae bacterium]